MSQDNKWSIQELIARYELEPELLDVFVEGSFDREVLSHSSASRRERQTFYEVDSVDVPGAILARYGLTSGNKQRVIALSRELACLPPSAKVVCLADRDLDHWFDEVKATPRLKWTAFCSLESHFLTNDIIMDIAITTGRAKIKRFEEFTESLLGVLRQLYALRLADRQLQLSLSWVALRKYLTRVDDAIAFDAPKYVVALLTSNSKGSWKDRYETAINGWTKKLTCDIRHSSRGHDYTALLAWSISEFGGQKELANEVAVERLFVLLARSVATLSTELQ